MEVLDQKNIGRVSGGMKISGLRPSNNVINMTGANMGSWISASNTCWKPGTSTLVMYPSGNYKPNNKF